ncbi:tubby-like F-box protein 10 [Amborella trichopoda]|uniref:Tubby-like F-box protein n=1 Tax=Amborella trichopoda TaxID=13333 RepID=W1PZG2_AMBTC|nr:tubby-like F-box protein 10 [Amborella trichopoda]XP_011625931.1 tubby-like F-box protein 10 [Amborella trichopoda]XP_011625932.1 tubby-like F-box protein 10 [Amborella trichopoda]XP_011625933.1 tubby-like F-box protein 10 [Amborella trichopoda]XP_011625934.1 tubby-like F-box protein 10 [Amborella trichopoda]XP_020527304.1 tubby-like F-box protein 10 [Amborella trichopoda]XP_020527305.1 tubby-like F-box protein 10 [Amborella trichopoda]ERN12975.1 hypothetical protein AMTR_s00040p00040910 |eukprot:XP_006851394.1 tubby-like F-box protein 10 [Amborella trichopoda]
MSFRSIVRDVRDGFGSLSRRSFDWRLASFHKGKARGAVHELQTESETIQQSPWANLPPELLRDVINRLEASESAWPARKHVVACAAVCKSWRAMCKEIVKTLEVCGKLTFPISLKQPGPRDATIQCFIKRDKATLTYHLYLGLSPVLAENGKFLLSAKRSRRTTCTEYVISMDVDAINKTSGSYVGKMRSNFLGTKFIVYDTQPPHGRGRVFSSSPSSKLSGLLHSKRWTHSSRKVSPKVMGPTPPSAASGSYEVAEVVYELNVLGTRGPRRMHCTMHSIPASAVEPGGFVPLGPWTSQGSSSPMAPFGDSFSALSISSMDHRSIDFGSSRFSEVSGFGGPDVGFNGSEVATDDTQMGLGFDVGLKKPLVLRNKTPRWHEQLQCWCLNFRGRVTVASVKNFQLIAATDAVPTGGLGPVQPIAVGSTMGTTGPLPVQPPNEQERITLQFGKVGKDLFTMDYRYPLSAFQAFAICLSSFDTKLACE